ncbi:MAG TPA: cytochrome c biogenesis protein CcsA [Gemmataceae bacterium]|jgi:ABC-type transport system involved in cytochrome c biogenesis permease subunit|nr:cytochrome c biogenesis protein CcsA [Gemmataceae bacterium]
MILSRFLPWLIAGLGAIYLMMMASAPARDSASGMHLEEFGRLPVLHEGRVKPFDTLARNTLMGISGRQYVVDKDGNEQSAVQWLLDVMTNKISKVPFPGPAEKAKVFRIENDHVLDLLGLAPRSGFRYSIEEFADKLPQLQEKADNAQKVPAKEQNLFEAKSIELAQHLQMYIRLSEFEGVELVPPEMAGGTWLTLREAILQEQQNGIQNDAARSIVSLLVDYGKADDYGKPDAQSFNRDLTSYRNYLAGLHLPELKTIDFEVFFNHFAPFYQCSVLYVFVFVLACLAFLGWSGPVSRAAFWLAIVTLGVHIWALIARMYLMDRWLVFVTNLYSSAVFIGCGSVILCLILEAIYRNGIGTLLASVLGSITLVIAHHLAATGDTLAQLQAVLDTNFWLATHVTCVTLGYTSTFVAGFLGIIYILRRVLSAFLNVPETRAMAQMIDSKSLAQMIYGIVCFAMFFSFTGTVLGGIWADQSWGRFWGWDPKENGALLIVLMNALILHARWAGMVKQRGMAVLAVCGNMVTGWSWFGTNQLGVGLHAYGFNNTLATGLTIFWLTQLGFIALGLIPLRFLHNFAQMLMPQAANGPHPQRKPEKQLA